MIYNLRKNYKSYILVYVGVGDFKKLTPTLLFIGGLSALNLIVQ